MHGDSDRRLFYASINWMNVALREQQSIIIWRYIRFSNSELRIWVQTIIYKKKLFFKSFVLSYSSVMQQVTSYMFGYHP